MPLSKSLSARALVVSALGGETAPDFKVAECDDTAALLQGLSITEGAVDIGAAGTAMRFLTAYYAATPGVHVVLTGSERMLRRPIGPLVEALRTLGADISYEGQEGYPPLAIRGKKLPGGAVEINSEISSQYISALLMVAPVMRDGIALTLGGTAVSMPYIRMTLAVMERFGVEASVEGNRITVAPARYCASPGFAVEGDWSAASYWFEIQALTCGWTALEGLTEDSLQGDKALIPLYDNLGVETSFEKNPPCACLEATPDLSPRFTADMSDTPDLAQAVAVTCAMLGVPFTLTGLRSLRIKETDRIAALAAELAKVGILLDIEGDEAISWDGTRRPIAMIPEFDTYNDHRMAMALAPVAVYIPGIVIRDASVVSKSYPGFWNDLRTAGFTVEEVAETGESS